MPAPKSSASCDRWKSSLSFQGFPPLNKSTTHLKTKRYEDFARQTIRMVRMMTTGLFRKLDLTTSRLTDYGDLLNVAKLSEELHTRVRQEKRPYFQVLIVDDLTDIEAKDLRRQLRDLRRADDLFFYEVVVVRSYEDALLAALINPDIQTCVVRYSFPFRSAKKFRLLEELHSLLKHDVEQIESSMPTERSLMLGKSLHSLRPS